MKSTKKSQVYTWNKSQRLQTLVQYLHGRVVYIGIFYFGLHQLAIWYQRTCNLTYLHIARRIPLKIFGLWPLAMQIWRSIQDRDRLHRRPWVVQGLPRILGTFCNKFPKGQKLVRLLYARVANIWMFWFFWKKYFQNNFFKDPRDFFFFDLSTYWARKLKKVQDKKKTREIK